MCRQHHLYIRGSPLFGRRSKFAPGAMSYIADGCTNEIFEIQLTHIIIRAHSSFIHQEISYSIYFFRSIHNDCPREPAEKFDRNNNPKIEFPSTLFFFKHEIRRQQLPASSQSRICMRLYWKCPAAAPVAPIVSRFSCSCFHFLFIPGLSTRMSEISASEELYVA